MDEFRIKKIDNRYIFSSCMMISIRFREKLSVVKEENNQLEYVFYYDIKNPDIYINLFLKDDRRYKYKNYNIPIKMDISKNKTEFEAFIIIDYNKIYEIKKEYNGEVMINYVKIVFINDEPYLIQSNNLESILESEKKLEINKSKIKKIKN